MELVIATHNPGKYAELLSGLQGVGVNLFSLKDFPGTPEAPETGETFSEIARSKAGFYYNHLGLAVLAEDSGLVIPALEGFPGIFSARIGNTDEERIRVVLEKMQEHRNREAYYHCSMVFQSGNDLIETHGRCDGRITTTARGARGFGYDPIFQPENLDRTFGEMGIEEKAGLSHRGRALQKMIAAIRTLEYP